MTDKSITYKACFITGTDTGVGKTRICLAMIDLLKQKGIRVAAMKPVASGSKKHKSGMQNKDALLIQARINKKHKYKTINPFALTSPIAPILAAKQQGTVIEAGPILTAFKTLSVGMDVVLVEGVGGWHVQLNDNMQMSDLVKLLQLPVIMVVGMRLGCINHAILTAEAIVDNGFRLLGWIGNQIDPDYCEPEASLELLIKSIGAPMLAAVPYLPQTDHNRIVSCLKMMNLPEIGLDGK